MIYALGIGSNSNSRFGNKLNTLKFVLKELERNNIKVIKKSKLYSSPPKNFKTAAETFLNAALVVETKLKPKNLLIILNLFLLPDFQSGIIAQFNDRLRSHRYLLNKLRYLIILWNLYYTLNLFIFIEFGI